MKNKKYLVIFFTIFLISSIIIFYIPHDDTTTKKLNKSHEFNQYSIISESYTGGANVDYSMNGYNAIFVYVDGEFKTINSKEKLNYNAKDRFKMVASKNGKPYEDFYIYNNSKINISDYNYTIIENNLNIHHSSENYKIPIVIDDIENIKKEFDINYTPRGVHYNGVIFLGEDSVDNNEWQYILSHEIGHWHIDNLSPNTPMWIQEGFSDYLMLRYIKESDYEKNCVRYCGGFTTYIGLYDSLMREYNQDQDIKTMFEKDRSSELAYIASHLAIEQYIEENSWDKLKRKIKQEEWNEIENNMNLTPCKNKSWSCLAKIREID